MKIDQIYLGIWFQRTSLHLKELYLHLQENGKASNGSVSDISSFEFVGNNEFDEVVGKNSILSFSITEDGIILLRSHTSTLKTARLSLENFYIHSFSPLLTTLFASQGAPIPKKYGKEQIRRVIDGLTEKVRIEIYPPNEERSIDPDELAEQRRRQDYRMSMYADHINAIKQLRKKFGV